MATRNSRSSGSGKSSKGKEKTNKGKSSLWGGAINCFLKNVKVTDVQNTGDDDKAEYTVYGKVKATKDKTVKVSIKMNSYMGQSLTQLGVDEADREENWRSKNGKLIDKGCYVTFGAGTSLRYMGTNDDEEMEFEFNGGTFEVEVMYPKNAGGGSSRDDEGSGRRNSRTNNGKSASGKKKPPKDDDDDTDDDDDDESDSDDEEFEDDED